ncbi:MAG: SDR family NAD(P)-dependent oxidoreductase [Aminivibrio sp.]|jgi:3-oxoacyl-[acyl-carrier protein] reductase
MELGLKGKVVVITGGSAGIGRAVAEAFALEGCRVVVCGRNRGRLEEVEKDFTAKGFEICTVAADVSQISQLEDLADVAVKKFGKIDVWINNAGLNTGRKAFYEVTEEQWHEVVNADFKSVFFGSAIAAEHMKKSGGGVILNTSSFTSIIPTCGVALYSAIKAAVDNLTRTMAAELACYKIRVLSVQPGYTHTALTASNIEKNFEFLVQNIAMRRLATPEDMANAFVFLASDAAGYINGISLPVAGAKLCVQNPMWSWQGNSDQK